MFYNANAFPSGQTHGKVRKNNKKIRNIALLFWRIFFHLNSPPQPNAGKGFLLVENLMEKVTRLG